MDVELAEERMKSLEHSEQHYFKRLVLHLGCTSTKPLTCYLATITMVWRLKLIPRTLLY